MKRRVFPCSMVLLALVFGSYSSAKSQTTQTVLAKAATAFSQGKPVNSVTLNATAAWTLGPDTESGTATLTANADGSYVVQLELGNGSRSESQTSFASGQTCSWSGSDGVSRPVAGHNCKGSMAWFMPAVALLGGQQQTTIATTFGPSSTFLDIHQQRPAPSAFSADQAALFARISASDLYLDPSTYLPVGLVYNQHPDNNAGADIPVQVVFTNYQSINGVMLPFHIQQYVNGVLRIDLTVTQATTN